MPNRPLDRAKAEQAFAWVQECLDEGFVLGGFPSAMMEAARRNKIADGTLNKRIVSGGRLYGLKLRVPEQPEQPRQPPKLRDDAQDILRAMLARGVRSSAELMGKIGCDIGQLLDLVEAARESGITVLRVGDRFEIPKIAQLGFLGRPPLEIVSDDKHWFRFGVVTDNHCGSKYERTELLADVYDEFAREGITNVFHAGNYLEGDARFNRFEVVATGLHAQSTLLANTYPQREGITTYAIWGDDHEGWYASSMGVDVGQYVQNVMRQHGREDWVDLGFLEGHVKLVNAASGAFAMMTVAHPGGGSSYALSYAIQKIIEALDGGEKPAIGIYGHYHKMWFGNIRNVWCLQPGCFQDQSTFIRKNKIQAHVGGVICDCRQDPETGAIVRFRPDMIRYFNKGFYGGRWSKHGPVNMAERTLIGD